MKTKCLIPLLALTPVMVMAEENNTWVDKKHETVSTTLDRWANNINSWLGDADPDKPGTASLRVMLDSRCVGINTINLLISPVFVVKSNSLS